MIEIIASVVNSIVSVLEHYRFFKGLVIGAVVDVIITALIAYPVWGFFNTSLFSILFIPCTVAAFYWQMKVLKK